MAARKARAKKPDKLATRAELARIAGVSLTTVDRWRRHGCPTVDVDGVPLYPIPELIEWRIERARDEVRREAGTPDVIDMKRVREREERARMELAELALEEARAEVVPHDLVVALVSEEFGNVASKIGSLTRYAGRLARAQTTAAAKKILEEAKQEVLRELSSGDAIAGRAREEGKGQKRVRGAARRIA